MVANSRQRFMQVTVLFNGKKQEIYLLDEPHIVIGRGRSAHIALDGNPIVSRQHAVIKQDGTQHVLEDLGGPNGTYVNDDQVDFTPLRPGDRIVLGKHTLRYEHATGQAKSLKRQAPRRSTAQNSAPTQQLDPLKGKGGFAMKDQHVEGAAGAGDAWGAAGRSAGGRRKRRRKKATAPAGGDRGAAGTMVASRDQLEAMLERQKIAAKPHLAISREGGIELVPVEGDEILIGHTDYCRVRLEGNKIFGKVAALVRRDGRNFFIAPKSAFWNPVFMGKRKLAKEKKLNDNAVFTVRGLRIKFSLGEQS